MTDAEFMDANCIHGNVWYDCKECDVLEPLANLGLATTSELMQELIARFVISAMATDDEFEWALGLNRARTLGNLFYGLDAATRNYRTVDS